MPDAIVKHSWGKPVRRDVFTTQQTCNICGCIRTNIKTGPKFRPIYTVRYTLNNVTSHKRPDCTLSPIITINSGIKPQVSKHMTSQQARHYLNQCHNIEIVRLSICNVAEGIKADSLDGKAWAPILHDYKKLHKMLQRGLSYIRGELKEGNYNNVVVAKNQKFTTEFLYSVAIKKQGKTYRDKLYYDYKNSVNITDNF